MIDFVYFKYYFVESREQLEVLGPQCERMPLLCLLLSLFLWEVLFGKQFSSKGHVIQSSGRVKSSSSNSGKWC